MLFEDAFNKYIKDQPAAGFGFELLKAVKQPDGYVKEIGGYYTRYANGYRLMIYGESLGETPVQESLILDKEDIVIARDTEDLKWPARADDM